LLTVIESRIGIEHWVEEYEEAVQVQVQVPPGPWVYT
jgi:hypothetical protein